MATARDKITPKKQSSDGANLNLRVNQPDVKVRMPEIKIPEIKIPAINVPAADMKPVAEAVNALGQALGMLAQQQTAILEVIQALASKEAKIEVKPADVKLPATQRPRSFYVELDKDDGETVGMRITAEALN